MRVTAVMQCSHNSLNANGHHQLTFHPPYALPKEGVDPRIPSAWTRVNENWSKATPAGGVQLTISVPGVATQFEVGKNYLLTFEPLPEE